MTRAPTISLPAFADEPDVQPHPVHGRRSHQPLSGRRVAVLTVHHVHVGDQILTGGAEKYILSALRALLDMGAAVHVGYSGTSIYEDVLAEIEPSRLTIERTGWIDDVLSGDSRLELKTILDRRRWLRATRADTLFVVQQAAGGAFAASLLAAKSLGMRVVASIRQQPEPLPASLNKRWLGVMPSPEIWRRRLVWRRILPAWLCNNIIYNSRRVAGAYEAEYGFPADRACIIPNGETIRPRANDLPGSEINIGTVGRVSEAKGVFVLLDAFARIARKHPGATLTFYGDGPHAPALRSRAAFLRLSHRVRFPGHVSDRQAIYSDIGIYAQMSLRESMSNSVLEAMAYGIPCVVSDVGGQAEAVVNGVSGLVVQPKNVASCAGALDRLLSEPQLRRAYGRGAHDRVATRFRADAIAQRTAHAILGIPL